MQLFTDTQKAAIQRIYDRVVAAARQRYGDNIFFEGVEFSTDENGQITSMRVQVNTATPPDVDGDVVRQRKQVEVWE